MLSRVVPAGFKPLNQHWDSSSRGATVYTLERSAWQQRLIWAHWESPAVTCGGRRSNGRQTALPAADFLADPPSPWQRFTAAGSGSWCPADAGPRCATQRSCINHSQRETKGPYVARHNPHTRCWDDRRISQHRRDETPGSGSDLYQQLLWILKFACVVFVCILVRDN